MVLAACGAPLHLGIIWVEVRQSLMMGTTKISFNPPSGLGRVRTAFPGIHSRLAGFKLSADCDRKEKGGSPMPETPRNPQTSPPGSTGPEKHGSPGAPNPPSGPREDGPRLPPPAPPLQPAPDEPAAPRAYVNWNDALRELNLTDAQLKRLVSEGEIRGIRGEGGNMKFRREEIERLKAANNPDPQGPRLAPPAPPLEPAPDDLLYDEASDLELGDEDLAAADPKDPIPTSTTLRPAARHDRPAANASREIDRLSVTGRPTSSTPATTRSLGWMIVVICSLLAAAIVWVAGDYVGWWGSSKEITSLKGQIEKLQKDTTVNDRLIKIEKALDTPATSEGLQKAQEAGAEQIGKLQGELEKLSAIVGKISGEEFEKTFRVKILEALSASVVPELTSLKERVGKVDGLATEIANIKGRVDAFTASAPAPKPPTPDPEIEKLLKSLGEKLDALKKVPVPGAVPKS